MNILFIMADQWRADCLGSAGHPLVATPHLDALAAQGVRCDRAFVQSAVCGPSRMSFLTGRYVHAHRSSWNGVPLPEDERTLDYYFSDAGYQVAGIGKVGYPADGERLPSLEAAGYDRARDRLAHPGSAWYERQQGGYAGFLRAHGYNSADPVNEFANTVITPSGRMLSGWDFRAAPHPLRVRAEHSRPAFQTDLAMRFIKEAKQPWLLQLSYIEPHWPIVAPAPYHAMYDRGQVPEPQRHPRELEHPLLEPFRTERRSRPLDSEWVWRSLRATYYGMMSLVDDQLGRLFHFLRAEGLWDQTVIVFVSDHGEYLGDHWLFEKELFYEQAVRIPWIMRSPGRTFDATRGQAIEAFVESVDLVPTLLDLCGLPLGHRLQGRSLVPLLRGESPGDWRRAVVTDWDYRFYGVGERLGIPPQRRRAWMIRDDRFKYVHFLDLPPMLFDLENDPAELHNLAQSGSYQDIIARKRLELLEWRMAHEDPSRSEWLRRRKGSSGVAVPADGTANYGPWGDPATEGVEEPIL